MHVGKPVGSIFVPAGKYRTSLRVCNGRPPGSSSPSSLPSISTSAPAPRIAPVSGKPGIGTIAAFTPVTVAAEAAAGRAIAASAQGPRTYMLCASTLSLTRSTGSSRSQSWRSVTRQYRYTESKGPREQAAPSRPGSTVFYFLGQGGLYVAVVLSPLSNLNSALICTPALGHLCGKGYVRDCFLSLFIRRADRDFEGQDRCVERAGHRFHERQFDDRPPARTGGCHRPSGLFR